MATTRWAGRQTTRGQKTNRKKAHVLELDLHAPGTRVHWQDCNRARPPLSKVPTSPHKSPQVPRDLLEEKLGTKFQPLAFQTNHWHFKQTKTVSLTLTLTLANPPQPPRSPKISISHDRRTPATEPRYGCSTVVGALSLPTHINRLNNRRSYNKFSSN